MWAPATMCAASYNVQGHRVLANALTHVHPDHQGASHIICTVLHMPLWCGAADASAMDTGDIARQFASPPHPMVRMLNALWTGPAHPVTRHLREGDAVGSFVVVESPVHTLGHVAYWREADRLLIVGDAANNMNAQWAAGLARGSRYLYVGSPAEPCQLAQVGGTPACHRLLRAWASAARWSSV